MVKKILVLQFRTDKSLMHERDCIIKTGDFKRNDLRFINALNGRSKLPGIRELDKYKGVIVGGSGQINISDWSKNNKAKIMRVRPILKTIINKDIPMLNICFGHQLVSYFLKGGIKSDPKQAETGTYRIYLEKTAKNSPLFKDMPQSFYAVLGHKDSVTKLPKEAKLLAHSDNCSVQSYQIKNNIYSVQFHPEIDKKAMLTRLNLYPSYVKNNNSERVLKTYKETSFAKLVIKNFKHICDTIKN